MLSTVLLLSLGAAAPTAGARLTSLPLPGDDPAHAALGRAVAGAAYAAAQARGLIAVDVASVKPVEEAIAACGVKEECRIHTARRLGVRFLLLPTLDGERASVRLLDLEDGATRAAPLEGDRRAILAAAPVAVDQLLEQVAPRALFVRTQALERAAALEHAGDALGAARLVVQAEKLERDLELRFHAAALFREAGAPEEASALLRTIVDDEASPADLRLRALVELHGA